MRTLKLKNRLQYPFLRRLCALTAACTALSPPPQNVRGLGTQLKGEEGVKVRRAYQEVGKGRGVDALNGISTLILDQDGVLWRANNVFPTTVPSINTFRQMGKRLLFLTNNSGLSRKQYVQKYKKLGLEVSIDEVIPSSYLAAQYLDQAKFQGKVLYIGGQGTLLELEEHGFDVVECPGDKELTISNPDLSAIDLDPEISAVVLAHDPTFTYRKLCIAAQYLRNPDTLFIVTNMDSGDLIDNGRIMPGTGSMASALMFATGRDPINTGKGGSTLLTREKEDRLDTDIALGKQARCKTALPLTSRNTLIDPRGASADLRHGKSRLSRGSRHEISSLTLAASNLTAGQGILISTLTAGQGILISTRTRLPGISRALELCSKCASIQKVKLAHDGKLNITARPAVYMPTKSRLGRGDLEESYMKLEGS
ncbi:hypothetical protein AAMO2058_000279800 [Amorphochlora amoebiformis]